MTLPAPIARELILVGGGHSHVQLLRRFAMAPLPADVRVSLVVDRPVATYSGMVPGRVAGDYTDEALEIDLVPLARKARARLILSPASHLDAGARRLHLPGRPPLAYDLLSLNIGSTVLGGLDPDVAAFALPTRPIGRFVERLEARLAALPPGPVAAVVVGAGAGGVELAFCIEARLRKMGHPAEVTLISAQPEPLAGQPAAARQVRAAAAARGVRLVLGERVVVVGPSSVTTSSGSQFPHQLLLWVTGAMAHPFGLDSGLPTDGRGFIQVRDDLSVLGHDDLFAAGDCAILASWPEQPRAGVYAVREGPVLEANLRARLMGRRTEDYRPQRDFLALFNLGDGTAIAARNGLAARGRWAFALKDWIDRRFMARFQVLSEAGDLASAFAQGMPAEVPTEMVCGGCAAKVGAEDLHRALGRLPAPKADADVLLGVEGRDDVAAVRWGGADLCLTLDAFPAPVDDPYLAGLLAAQNALSDLWAKGARPRFALALVTLPLEEGHPDEALFQVMSGARAALDAAGVTLLGGHSLVGPRLVVGFTVLGESPSRLGKGGLRPGDAMVLSRALGTGVVLAADQQGRARGRDLAAALGGMVRGNADAASVLEGVRLHAATDVTGFGLAGHLGELLRASGCAAEVDLDALPALPGAVRLLEKGLRSTLHAANAAIGKALFLPRGLAQHPHLPLLFDPQTCGGLLVGLPYAQAPALVEALRAAGDEDAALIGHVTESRADGALFALTGGAPRPGPSGR